MPAIEKSNKLNVLNELILELPDSVQDQIFEYVKFLHNKHFYITDFDMYPDFTPDLKEIIGEKTEESNSVKNKR
jgi:hypothetical protein